MLAKEFFSLVSKKHVTETAGIEDFADRLSFQWSVILLLVSCAVIGSKQYLLTPLSCYIPTIPAGHRFDVYASSYCWVHGTIPIRSREHMPTTLREWAKLDQERKLNYYQWIPFVLAIQCFMFYLPRVLWLMLCHNRTGTDLQQLVTTAMKASHSYSKRDKLIDFVAGNLDDMCFQHQKVYKTFAGKCSRRLYKICSLLAVSRHMGMWLVLSYSLVKALFLLNAIGQLYLMQKFLGFENDALPDFGWKAAWQIISGVDWEDSLVFPRISFCYIGDIRHLVGRVAFTAQCTLSVNMLAEKIYIFLWFWFFFVAMVTACSIPTWFIRISSLGARKHFIKKFLRLAAGTNSIYQNRGPENAAKLDEFVNLFLQHDGVFILRILYLNVGDLITASIVSRLWEIYCRKYYKRHGLEEPKKILRKREEVEEISDEGTESSMNEVEEVEKISDEGTESSVSENHYQSETSDTRDPLVHAENDSLSGYV